MNDKNARPVGRGIDKFVIANAKELLSIDFACWTSEADGTASPLVIERNATLNTVSLKLATGSIQPFYVKDIFFGNSMTDLNLCGANGTVAQQAIGTNPQFYTLAAEPDLTKNVVQINITGSQSTNSAQPDLTMTLQVLNGVDTEKHDSDILCISWTYTDHSTGKKMPYTVPMDIAGIDKTILSDEGKLSDWIDIKLNKTTKAFEIEVKQERNFFTLSSEMSFGEYINII